MRRRLVFIGALVVALAAVSGGIALAARGDDDRPMRGSALERANAAALEHVGGGRVVETEAGDDVAYSVEVRRTDGSVVEVNLNRDFDVVGSEPDDDGADGSGEPDDG